MSRLGPSLSIDGDSTGCASCAALRARCQKLEADMACRNQLRARVAELEAENERLREIERRAWHAFDDSVDRSGEGYLVSRDLAEKLFEVLPEEPPTRAALEEKP